MLGGRPLSSSCWVEQRYGIVNLWRDEVIVRVVWFLDRIEALKAAGLER
jgi:hypothetical protein